MVIISLDNSDTLLTFWLHCQLYIVLNWCNAWYEFW